jgi:hypothetical protein
MGDRDFSSDTTGGTMKRTIIISAALGAAVLVPAAATAKPVISPIGSAAVQTYAARAGAPLLPAGITMQAMKNTRNAFQSANWGGYVDTVRSPRNAFQSVGTTFRVPTVNVLTTTDGPAGNMAAQWVGLDGATPTSTLEQTGVAEWLDSNLGIPHYIAWWEMIPDPMVGIANVSAGDLIRANVHAYGPSVPAGFVLTLSDQTQHWSNVQAVKFTNVTPPRNSSEVITELPTSSDGAMDLTDYGNVQYTNSGTSTSSTPHSLASNSAYTAHKIILVDSNGNTMAAVSALSHGTAFNTPFISSGNN